MRNLEISMVAVDPIRILKQSSKKLISSCIYQIVQVITTAGYIIYVVVPKNLLYVYRISNSENSKTLFAHAVENLTHDNYSGRSLFQPQTIVWGIKNQTVTNRSLQPNFYCASVYACSIQLTNNKSERINLKISQTSMKINN